MPVDESTFGARIRELLQPFAASFSGSLGRGDLVIPRSEIERVVREILSAARDAANENAEVSELELFRFLSDTRRLGSVQDQASRLLARFVVRERR
ncbi:MAG: hypothetical protein FJ144_16665 [Deltaproteobacteria bacterium]|nr:hypothetical protein [Deltaproteobacteria bacterium]